MARTTTDRFRPVAQYDVVRKRCTRSTSIREGSVEISNSGSSIASSAPGAVDGSHIDRGRAYRADPYEKTAGLFVGGLQRRADRGTTCDNLAILSPPLVVLCLRSAWT